MFCAEGADRFRTDPAIREAAIFEIPFGSASPVYWYAHMAKMHMLTHRSRNPSGSRSASTDCRFRSDMAEGFRMVANVQGIEVAELRPGLPVRVSYQDLEEDFTVPVFEHAERG